MKLCVVHGGRFHIDDVVCGTIMSTFGHEIRRITNGEANDYVDDQNVIMMDIGNQYNGFNRFDHHQQDRITRHDGVPYSACGLIWKTFGEDFIRAIIPNEVYDIYKKIYNRIDNQLIYNIDISDNGVDLTKRPPIGEMVNVINMTSSEHGNNDENYKIAVDIMSLYLTRKIKHIHNEIVSELVIQNMTIIDRIGFLEKFVPYIPYMEKYMADIDFVVYPNYYKKDEYCIRTLPISKSDKTYRKSFHPALLRKFNANNSDLDISFIHQSGFIAVVNGYDTVFKFINYEE